MIQHVFQIHGPARSDRVRDVIDVIRQKNQILRTRLVQHNGAFYQVVVNDRVEWYEGTNLSQYRRHIRSPDGRFRLGDPLFRYAFTDEGRDIYFVYTAHHSGWDMFTNSLVFDVLEGGLQSLEALRQKPSQTQFKQFSKWLEDRSAAKDKTSKSITFWKSYLDGFPCSANRIPDGIVLMSDETGSLTKIMPLKRRASTFPLSTMAHAAWAISLGNFFQLSDILFVFITSGRRFPSDDPLPRAETIMGQIATATYLRTRLRINQTIDGLLQDTQKNILSMIPYQRESRNAAAEVLGQQIYTCQP